MMITSACDSFVHILCIPFFYIPAFKSFSKNLIDEAEKAINFFYRRVVVVRNNFETSYIYGIGICFSCICCVSPGLVFCVSPYELVSILTSQKALRKTGFYMFR